MNYSDYSIEIIKYGEVSDILEYGDITDEEAVALCNDLLNKSVIEQDDTINELMYEAICMGVSNRDIAGLLNIDDVEKVIDKFNEAVVDYFITIMAYTGNRKYIDIIQKMGKKFIDLDIDEAINELIARE